MTGDWVSVRIPMLMAGRLDKFLQTDIAKGKGITSRNDIATRIIESWLSYFEREYPEYQKNRYNPDDSLTLGANILNIDRYISQIIRKYEELVDDKK